MKFLALLLFIVNPVLSFGQGNKILLYEKYFNTGLKQWKNSLRHFRLSDLEMTATDHFENNYEQDLKDYRSFLSIYKPIITYSPDSTQFIDIYSYQLGLEKRKGYYYANPDVDQAILLCNRGKKYWNRIYFGTPSQWIEEVVWLSETTFILAGITNIEADKRIPFILLGDTGTQTLETYRSKNEACVQGPARYRSAKLTRIKIKTL